MTWSRYLETKRRECWTLGIQHREALLREYVIRTGTRERPFLKDVVDDLLIYVQGVRLREECRPSAIMGQIQG